MAKADLQAPNAPWLTALKTARLLGWLLAVSVLANVGMGFSMSLLFPLKEIKPIFYEFKDSNDNFVMVQAAEGNLRANGRLIAMFLRQYVDDRETVDKQTEETIRYPRVMSMSDDAVATNFKNVYGNKSTGLYFREGFKRAVNITRDASLDYGLHQIEFQTIDTIEGKAGEAQGREPTVNEWVATVSYDFSNQLVSYDKSLMNPMGIFIQEYTLSKRRK